MTRPKRLGPINIGSLTPPLSLNFKMAERNEDTQLQDSLANYVRQNLKNLRLWILFSEIMPIISGALQLLTDVFTFLASARSITVFDSKQYQMQFKKNSKGQENYLDIGP